MCNNIDTEAAQTNQFYRFPFLEMCGFLGDPATPFPDLEMTNENVKDFFAVSLQFVNRMASPRFIKSHLPLEMLPNNLLASCKVVFVCRSVKDACVSWFHHQRINTGDGFNGTFAQFAQMFRNNEIMFGPFLTQVVTAWKLRNNPNMLFLSYEEMKQDLASVVAKLGKFLDETLEGDMLEKLLDAVHIDSMRKNRGVNKADEIKIRDGQSGSFIRKGVVGDWMNYFDQELSDEFDNWVKEELEDEELINLLIG